MAFNQTVNIYGPTQPLFIKAINTTVIKPKEFGLGFPIGSKAKAGYFNKSSGLENIKNGIKQLLKTERGERVMLPSFGCNLRKFLFQPLDEVTFSQIREEIVTSINNYTKDVKILKLGVFDMEQQSSYGSNMLKVVLYLSLKEEQSSQFEVEVVLK